MYTKSQQVRDLFAAGDHIGALRIAKDFKLGLSPEDRKTLKRGFECNHNPEFYRSLGRDPKKELADALILCSQL